MSKGGKGTLIRRANRRDSEPVAAGRVRGEMEEPAPNPHMGAAVAESGPASRARRRRIYIKVRLPAILAEMKSISDEKKGLAAKRKETQPEERKEANWRLNYLVERLAVLRDERTALIEESRQYVQPAAEEAKE